MKAILRHLGISGIILAGVAAAGITVTAHHSFAPFDLTVEKTITGTVTRFEWTNPHTWIWLDVPNAKGGVDPWAVEGMSPNFLARRGWTKSTLKVGDKVSIAIRPMKDGKNAGMYVRATLADGRVLSQVDQPKD